MHVNGIVLLAVECNGYLTYNRSASDLVIGGAFAFLDGIVDAYIGARLYDRFAAESES
jgi:hypothetical protein